jgi:class 3 adenylate cyclase/tetratricopeptide (TPR) repeat protein
VPGRRERKVVTVLFADLVGFTSRSEQLDPEDVAEELGSYHSHVREELERYGGTVEKFIGDAVMAVFGAPVAHEDDPERAVRAALGILAWAEEEGIEMRIGVNTGEALVTVDARPEAGEGMAAGDVVNTAARLQSGAPVGGVLVGEQTYRATERTIEYGGETAIEAKGKAEPVPAWPAVQARARVGVDRVHGAHLAGRAREVALLEDALARTMDERSPQLVTLVGVPGIGKSRLVLELFHAVERLPDFVFWRHGRCLPYGEGVTFWALGEMVKAHAGILEGDSEANAEAKLRAVTSDPWLESHLRPLVGLPGGAEARGDARDEAFTAWRRFFEDLAAERPLVLVFEDLHWADDNLLDFVDHLVDWASGVPLLVVGTARPELLTRRPGWGGGKPNALTISLSPLSDDETSELLHELLGSVLPAETKEQLLGNAGGNPLYAEEFARMLRDRGGGGAIPETVQGLIAARLDLLEPDQKALLQDAAVIGKRFWTGAVASLGNRDDAEAGLHELQRKEFVRRERASSVTGENEYGFRHLLVRDVAYGQIPRADRAAKHLAAAAWIEQLSRREDHAEMLAHHSPQALQLTAAAGGDSAGFAARARAALADAGERALSLSAFDASTRYFTAAFDLAPEGDVARARIAVRLGHAMYLHGKNPVELLEDARDELLAAGHTEDALEAELELVDATWMAGEGERALGGIERAQELARDLPPSRLKARVFMQASQRLFLAGHPVEAIVNSDAAIALAEELGGLDDIRAAAMINAATARPMLGSSRWREELEEATRAARAATGPYDIVRALGNTSSWCLLYGELEESLRIWDEAYREALAYGQTGFARWFRGVHTQLLYELGRWDESKLANDAFLAEVEAGAPHYLAVQAYSVRALLCLGRGDETGALGAVDRALELVTHHSDPQSVYPVYAVTAFVLTELGEIERAREPAGLFLASIADQVTQPTSFEASRHHMLAWSLAALGLLDELVSALPPSEVPWTQAALAVARGAELEAASILGGIGAVASQAFCRLSAARGGDHSQLDAALAFYRSVGATRYLREGESLLATSRSA